jgi:hypothetical protein
MTKVTAQMSISLAGCNAGPMGPRDPQDAARRTERGPEAGLRFRTAYEN